MTKLQDAEHVRNRVSISRAILWAAVASIVAATLTATVVLALDRDQRAPISEWIPHFLTSPGVGGIGALVAAGIAYFGISKQVRAASRSLEHQRAAEENRSWWERFEWASARAVPSKSDEKPLPYNAILSTLSELADSSRDDVQKLAVRAIMDTAQDDSPQEADDATASKGRPEDDSARLRALQLYSNATRNTAAHSPVVEGQIYELEVLQALREIPSIQFIEPSRSLSGSTPDAVIVYREHAVIVEIKSYGGKTSLSNSDIDELKSFTETNEASHALVISPERLKNSFNQRGYLEIETVSWKSPEDTELVISALNLLVPPPRRARLA